MSDLWGAANLSNLDGLSLWCVSLCSSSWGQYWMRGQGAEMSSLAVPLVPHVHDNQTLLSSQLHNLTVRNNALQKPELNKRLFSVLASRHKLGWVWGRPHPVLPTPCLEGRADPPAPSQPEFQGHLRSLPSPWLWPILLYIGSYYMKKVPFPTFRDNNSMNPLFIDEVQAS